MLTDRQIELLEYIIREHMTSSEPVGSTFLVEKYNLKYSPATVRNEMAKLLDEGFLEMVHTSSGRVPTSRAYRYYLSDLMEEEDFPVLQEVAIKQRLWSERYDFYKLIREVAISLADITKELSIVTSEGGYVVPAGIGNILENKEFWDIDVAKAAMNLLDRYELLEKVFNSTPSERGNVYCVMGEELGDDNLAACSMLFSPYRSPKHNGYVAILGPSRMNYQNVIPAVRYTANLVGELTSAW
ncbi:MAG: hypothetical protein WC243_01335 [Patescibacteria group bacterium]|jgi:transcriptional regulator of heat shock response